MKTLVFIIIGLLFQYTSAQNYIPIIENNTDLNYICKLHGQTRTLTLTTKIVSDTLVFKLETRGVKSSIVQLPEAIESGTELSYNQGEYSDVLILKPSETFFLISKSAYKNLVEKNQFVYNNTTYVVDNTKEEKVIINGQELATWHVVAEIDETEIWILKNPNFPLLCKMTKNPLGINFTLTEIVNK